MLPFSLFIYFYFILYESSLNKRINKMTCYLNFEDIALGLSIHAYQRRMQRGVGQKQIAHLLRFGRKQYQNNAIYYSIGNKEIKKYAKQCPALKEMNGFHLVMALNGTILTLFRNRNFGLLRR